MIITQKYAVSKVAETVKKNITGSLSRRFTFLRWIYWNNQEIWEKVISYLQWEENKNLSEDTQNHKKRKKQDKQSLYCKVVRL